MKRFPPATRVRRVTVGVRNMGLLIASSDRPFGSLRGAAQAAPWIMSHANPGCHATTQSEYKPRRALQCLCHARQTRACCALHDRGRTVTGQGDPSECGDWANGQWEGAVRDGAGERQSTRWPPVTATLGTPSPRASSLEQVQFPHRYTPWEPLSLVVPARTVRACHDER